MGDTRHICIEPDPELRFHSQALLNILQQTIAGISSESLNSHASASITTGMKRFQGTYHKEA